MRTTKAGLTIIEDNDSLPDCTNVSDQLFVMINMLRKEHNKAAEMIDKLQDEIDELKKAQGNK